MVTLDRSALHALLQYLRDDQYTVIGPVLRSGTISYDEIESLAYLPEGLIDHQRPGSYRLERRSSHYLFGFAVGPNSLKRYFFPPSRMLFAASREGKSFHVEQSSNGNPKYAFVGVRACEIAALKIHDRVFMGTDFQDSHYAAVRRNAIVIAVNCTRAGEQCFCTSMQTGPEATNGLDLLLTEIPVGDSTQFIAEVGSERGETVLAAVPSRPTEENELRLRTVALDGAKRQIQKQLDTQDLKSLLQEHQEQPIWEEVAKQCLMCANCTMVCPTCFCSTVEDVTDLNGNRTERHKRWDSCFTLEFGKVAGGNFRRSGSARYRQWITHKLASWHDQFGMSGCVGCGRCITWCPVGIDITQVADRVRALDLQISKEV